MDHACANPNTPRDAWEAAPTIEQLTAHDIWALRRGFLERLWPDVRGWKVAEIGSGPAHDSLTFAQRGAHVTALDCSPRGLDLARQFYGRLKLPIETVVGDAMALSFDDAAFDLVFNAGVLEHFTDDQLERVLDEMIRVVRPGGHILAFLPNRLNVFYQANLRRARKHSYDFERAFTAAEMRARFESRGLHSVRLSGVHVHPAPQYLLPAWLPKHHKIEPACRRLFRGLENARGLNRIKSLIGQDFVVWAQVPQHRHPRRSLVGFTGGPAVALSSQAA